MTRSSSIVMNRSSNIVVMGLIKYHTSTRLSAILAVLRLVVVGPDWS